MQNDAHVSPTAWVSLPWLGTGAQREGLLSYMVRLAATYSMSPRTLVRGCFAPHLSGSLRVSDAAFHEQYAGTINGLGRYAEAFSAVVAQKCGTETLKGTLLALRHVLPPNGMGLLGRCRKWCPECLSDWQVRCKTVWWPLLWSLEGYRCCHVHEIELIEFCPACGTTQPYLPAEPYLDRCAACGGFLCNSTRTYVADQQLGRPSALAKLLEDLHPVPTDLSLDGFRSVILGLVRDLADGNRAEFCRRVALQPRALNNWITKNERPSMEIVSHLSEALGVPIVAFFSSTPPQPAASFGTIPGRAGVRDRPGHVEREGVAAKLKAFTGSKPMTKVLHDLGLSRGLVKYHLPREYADAASRRGQALRRHRDEISVQRNEILGRIVGAMVSNGIYPSRRKVDAALRLHGLSLQVAEVREAFRRISDRYSKERLG